MKKAFTLIELLVVIAIIAILAAILFPVFAQAKTAAKKTAAISNQKQIGIGFMLYLADNDDVYPRRSGCELNSSINSKLNDGTLRCGGAAGFAHSMTWQTWQKYIFPYVKNTELFFHPLRQKDAVQWNDNGQILNSFVVNLSIIGAATTSRESIPWTGGSQTGIPNTGSTMLTMEMPNTYAVPFVVRSGSGNPETVYPLAIREYWQRIVFKVTGGDNCGTTNEPDPVGAPAGGVTVSNADGSARFVQAGKLLGMTPTSQEYIGTNYPFGSFSSNCRRTTNVLAYSGGLATPNTNLNAPFWGLGQ
ncbi:MAG: prepilin-type N-terminal cleavage/methylation domain-containing protein [Fimbriimonas sp.]